MYLTLDSNVMQKRKAGMLPICFSIRLSPNFCFEPWVVLLFSRPYKLYELASAHYRGRRFEQFFLSRSVINSTDVLKRRYCWIRSIEDKFDNNSLNYWKRDVDIYGNFTYGLHLVIETCKDLYECIFTSDRVIFRLLVDLFLWFLCIDMF